MCGISAIITNKYKLNMQDTIEQMNQLIEHRGPDSSGQYIEERVGLGHQRLSIIDLEEVANQPFINDKYVLVFNGEIYNYKEIKEKIGKYTYKSQSDTEVILAAYEKWGIECVQYFRGMWAFVLYDKKEKIIFASRDRFGIKPLYYYNTDNYIALASEIKQFIILPEWKAILNKDRIQEFIVFGVLDHTQETMFKSVLQLLPGHNLIYDLNKNNFEIKRYYDLESAIKKYDIQDFESSKKQLLKQFREAIQEHLVADVEIGSCLSGGIDSSSIVVMMNEILNGKQTIQTISSCFEDKKYDEQEYIDEVLKMSTIIGHKTFPQCGELIKELKDLVWHQDEPFGSTSIFAQKEVFKCAKSKGLKVMLDGQGADEQLMGYHSFYQAYFTELFLENNTEVLQNELREYQSLNPTFTNEIFYERCVKQQTEELDKVLKDRLNRPDRMLKPDFNLYYNYYKELNEAIKNPISLSLHQMSKSSLPQLLHYEDRNSMTYSIESRVPFLDHRFVEYICSLPREYKLKENTTKAIFRESMGELLPEKIRNRKDKMGFVTPELTWIRENYEVFLEYFEKGCSYLEDFINKDKAMVWFGEHIKTAQVIDFTIWRILCTGIWIEVFDIQVE